LCLEIAYIVREKHDDVVFGVAINRADGLLLHGSNTDIERVTVPQLGSRGRVLYRIKRLGLTEGSYNIDVAVHRQDGYPFDYYKGALEFKIRSALNQVGIVTPQSAWEFYAAKS